MVKQRYEYYKGSTAIIDNETDEYVEDVVDVLNQKDFNINELLKTKQLQTKQIADLEAKLVESEKDRLMWQEMYKGADKQNKNICETDIYPLQEENQQLKDKLEIKMEELHIAYCGIENVKTKNGNLKAEIKELKQQLAEKEKEETKKMEDFEKGCQEYYKSNQIAIAELEKAKVKLNEEINNANVLLDPVEYEDYHELLGVIRGYKLSVDQIDQQIKSLKGDNLCGESGI